MHRLRQVSGPLLDARHTDGLASQRKPSCGILEKSD
jgi:hypothetical protein